MWIYKWIKKINKLKFMAGLLRGFSLKYKTKTKVMKFTEKQKQKVCDLIQESLNTVTLNGVMDENDEMPLALIDYLSHDEDTIKTGRKEIEHIVEQIYYDMEDWNI